MLLIKNSLAFARVFFKLANQFFIYKSMKNLSPEELTILATTFAIDIAKSKNDRQLVTVKNFIGQVYSSLNTICIERTIRKNDKN